MTTMVKVLIEGDKKCQVKVLEGDDSDKPGNPPEVMPGTFTTVIIHGEQKVTVIETGDFIS
jgi:hypothetical protein